MRYEYDAVITRVIDGDTVVATIDLGFCVYTSQTLRLYGINAPETRGKDLTDEQRALAWKATHYLKEIVETHSPITVRTVKDKTGKYGRYLATLFGVEPETDKEVDLNQKMVSSGFAVPLYLATGDDDANGEL